MRTPVRYVLMLAFIAVLSGCCPPFCPEVPSYGVMVNPPATAPAGGTHAIPIPVSWDLKFTNGSHHIKKLALMNEIFTDYELMGSTKGYLEWEARIEFADKNGDDNYDWDTEWVVLALSRSFVHYGTSAWLEGRGHSGKKHNGQAQNAHWNSFTSPELKSYRTVVVVLMGWEFELDDSDSDMHLSRVGVRINDVDFIRDNGIVTWNAQSVFTDDDGDEPYNWRYQYAVVALPYANSLDTPSSITDSPGDWPVVTAFASSLYDSRQSADFFESPELSIDLPAIEDIRFLDNDLAGEDDENRAMYNLGCCIEPPTGIIKCADQLSSSFRDSGWSRVLLPRGWVLGHFGRINADLSSGTTELIPFERMWTEPGDDDEVEWLRVHVDQGKYIDPEGRNWTRFQYRANSPDNTTLGQEFYDLSYPGVFGMYRPSQVDAYLPAKRYFRLTWERTPSGGLSFTEGQWW